MELEIGDSYLGRKVVYLQEIKSLENGDDTFGAYYRAASVLSDMGYTTGSMERYNPIGFIPSESTSWVAKWNNIDHAERKQLHGCMRSNDFREGTVQLIWWEIPLDPPPTKFETISNLITTQ